MYILLAHAVCLSSSSLSIRIFCLDQSICHTNGFCHSDSIPCTFSCQPKFRFQFRAFCLVWTTYYTSYHIGTLYIRCHAFNFLSIHRNTESNLSILTGPCHLSYLVSTLQYTHLFRFQAYLQCRKTLSLKLLGIRRTICLCKHCRQHNIWCQNPILCLRTKQIHKLSYRCTS